MLRPVGSARWIRVTFRASIPESGEYVSQSKKKAVNEVSRSQAQRLLESARAAKSGGSSQNFSRAMGKLSLQRNGRKTAKGGIGGGAE